MSFNKVAVLGLGKVGHLAAELLAEAGFKLNGSLVREGCVDQLVLYLAPSLLGPDALGLFNLPAIESLDAGRKMRFHDVRQIGRDLRLVTRWAD